MKIALSLSGMPRFINNSLESQLISLGLTLSNNDSIDIHSCLWGNSNEIKEAEKAIFQATESAKEYLKCRIQIATINTIEQASSRTYLKNDRRQYIQCTIVVRSSVL